MIVVSAGYEILRIPNGKSCLLDLEEFGRTCYQSLGKIHEGSAEKFVAMLIRKGHESVLEHHRITVKFICDRGVSHEMVRHRLASFSQESTRFCNYSKGAFGKQITVICPPFDNDKFGAQCATWYNYACAAEEGYMGLLERGASPQDARALLPVCLKTEVIMTTNLRHWRNVLAQRVDKDAHPQMRELMVPLLAELKTLSPVVFDDIGVYNK
jgi:thymidylate synthase (FAD)